MSRHCLEFVKILKDLLKFVKIREMLTVKYACVISTPPPTGVDFIDKFRSGPGETCARTREAGGGAAAATRAGATGGGGGGGRGGGGGGARQGALGRCGAAHAGNEQSALSRCLSPERVAQ